MEKNILKEIAKMRKMMGLTEEIEMPSKEKFNFEKSAIESATGDKVVQREFDVYDRPLFYSLSDKNVNYFIGDGDNGKVIFKYNSKTGKNHQVGDLKDYDAPERAKDSQDNELFEGGRSDKYDDSNGSPYDRGTADSYYRRSKNPHKYPKGTYKSEKITDLTPEELEAYEAGYEDNEISGDFKDWGED
jgi:hypothetical protein